MSDLFFPVSLPCLRLVSRSMVANTAIQASTSGREARVGRWSGPKYRYAFELSTRDSLTERSQIETFFSQHGGMRSSFQLVDPVDGETRRVRFDDDELEMECLSKPAGVYRTQFDLVTTNGAADEGEEFDGGGGLY